jgi:hypothetical protein
MRFEVGLSCLRPQRLGKRCLLHTSFPETSSHSLRPHSPSSRRCICVPQNLLNHRDDAQHICFSRRKSASLDAGCSYVKSGGEGGLYCSFFPNSLVFCHFTRKTRIFCRLRTSLSSLSRLSSALQSLLWTSKVPKKSNMSNKSGFLFWAYFHCRGLECGKSSANFPGVADRIASLGTLPAPSTVACRATRVPITGVIEYPNHMACKEGVTASIPTTFTKGILKRGS